MQATAQYLSKAREAQHEYLRGRLVTANDTIDKITCPCGGAIKWWGGGRLDSGDTGKCTKKCGHEFIYLEQYKDAAGNPVNKGDEDFAETIRTVYCRRKMKGDHPFHIGELVTWWKDQAPKDGHQLNIPMDSPFYDWADYTGNDAIFLVIGVDMTGDRVLVATQEADGDGWHTLNPIEVQEITETTCFAYVGCFWCPIEYLESVSDWPYTD